MPRRFIVTALAAAAVAALAGASDASAAVRVVSVTSPNAPGDRATLLAQVSSPRALCSVTIRYTRGKTTRTARLAPRRAAGGRMLRTWTVDRRTKVGRWPVQVDCGKAGKARTTLLVRRLLRPGTV